MGNRGKNTMTLDLTSAYSAYTLTGEHDYCADSKRVPADTDAETEDPFVMGRNLFVLAVIELIIGVGLYRFFS
jgi:hypothetical protein